MTNYTKATDFASKDALLTGNPSKLVKGTEIGAEFDAIQSADASSVKGPGVSTDNAVMRWDGTAGYTAQNSGVTITDGNVITATGFTGAVNGTVGATTPSTGAFTTLSASGIVSAPASISLTNAGLATQAHIGGNGSGRVLINAIAGQEVDLQVAGATVLYASGATVGILGNTILGDASTDTLNVGNGGLIKDASGNIGLGVTPTYQLDVRSTLTGTTAGSNRIANLSANASGRDAYLAFGDNVNANAGMGYLSGALYWYANGAERMRLDASGNLGIGVTPSTWGDFDAIDIGPATSLYHNGGNASCGFAHNVYNNGANWILKTTAAAGVYSQLAGEHKWYATPSGAAGTTTILTQVLTVGKGTTLALEGATSAAGTGIAFPATQLASSNANTLNDYEEGVWTPTILSGGAAVGRTYTIQSGRYTKIGNNVTINCEVALSAKGSSAGSTQLGGLPFGALTDSKGCAVWFNNLTFTGQVTAVVSSAYINIYNTSSGGAAALIADTGLAATTSFVICASYNTNT